MGLRVAEENLTETEEVLKVAEEDLTEIEGNSKEAEEERTEIEVDSMEVEDGSPANESSMTHPKGPETFQASMAQATTAKARSSATLVEALAVVLKAITAEDRTASVSTAGISIPTEVVTMAAAPPDSGTAETFSTRTHRTEMRQVSRESILVELPRGVSRTNLTEVTMNRV